MASDNIAIIRFYAGWQQSGVGPDGLPLFTEVVRIQKSVPPLTQVDYLATPADIEEFPDQYKVFQRELAGRQIDNQGYPLALWPAAGPAEFQMCVARGVYTAEQLAALRPDNLPPQLKELQGRAKQMIALQGDRGQFEAQITDLKQKVEMLEADLKEANTTIAAQSAMIAQQRPGKGKAA